MLDVLKSVDPFAAALLFLGLLWVAYAAATGSARIWHLAVGDDGLFSTSRFQVFVWTVVILFSYAAVYVARLHVGRTEPIPRISSNVLLALGLTVGTAVAAAGITRSGLDANRVVKAAPAPVTPGLAALVTDDNGRPDLSKAQLLAWTSVAAIAYLFATGGAVDSTLLVTTDQPLPPLPDIDPTLMVLMGIGQGAYLGPKLLTTASIGVISLSTNAAKPHDPVNVYGVGFGKTAIGSHLLLNDRPVPTVQWSDTAITFTVPDTPPWGGSWVGQTVRISALVNGRAGATAQLLRVAPTP